VANDPEAASLLMVPHHAAPRSARTAAAARWALRLALSLWLVIIYYRPPRLDDYDRVIFHELIYGQAWRPFVTRALVPLIVRTSVLGPRHAFDARFIRQYEECQLHSENPFLREYLVVLLLSFACTGLFSFTLEKLWAALLHPSRPHAYLFSILGLLGLPAMFKYHAYIYDFPTLLLSTAGLLMIARQAWGRYLLIFCLASLNKETAILLVVIWALYFRLAAQTEPRSYWSFLLLQCVIYAVTRGALAYAFRENPGGVLEFHFTDHNLKLLTSPWTLPGMVTTGLLATMVFHRLGSKPWLLRCAARMLLILVAFTLFFGYLDELRDYFEVYAAVAALIGISVSEFMGSPVRSILPVDAAQVGSFHARD